MALLSLVGAVVVVTQVKSEFLPPEDRAQFQVNVELPTGTSLDATTEYVEAIAQDLRKNAPGRGRHLRHHRRRGAGAGQHRPDPGPAQPADQRSFHQEDVMAWVRERYQGVKNALFSVNPISPVGGDSGFSSSRSSSTCAGATWPSWRR